MVAKTAGAEGEEAAWMGTLALAKTVGRLGRGWLPHGCSMSRPWPWGGGNSPDLDRMKRLKREQQAREDEARRERALGVKPPCEPGGQGGDGDARRPPEGGPPADPAAPTPHG